MTKQNQHIEKYLDAYREMTATDFAVMITGPWGCGKTYFIKEYLADKESIYVSLNGLTDTTGVDLMVFKKLFPLAGKKPVAVAGKFIKEALKAGFNFNLSEALSISDFKAKIGGKLLVFDDLERCLLDPEETLGYINNFVEHGDTKVVIIGEEDHLNQSSNEKYRIIKEKLVGKTFRLTERIEEIFYDLISADIYSKTCEIIRQNKAVIVDLFQTVGKETKKHNYRALKHAFRDFEYFYPNMGPQFCENTEFLNALFRVFVALDYELQLGHFSISELKTRNPADYYASLMNKEDEAKREKTALEKVLERHGLEIIPIVAQNDLIFLEKLWSKILGSEQVGKQEIDESIKNSSYFVSKSQPEWITLWHWRRVEDADAAMALEKVRENLATYEYRDREVITHVFSILHGLAELRAIEETEDQILDAAQNYLSTIVEKKLLAIPKISLGYNWVHSGSFGLGYWREGSEGFQKLIKLIDAASASAVEESKQSSVEEWLMQLKNEPGVFFENINTDGKYYRDPILKYFQPSDFVDAIFQIPNETKWIIVNTLKKRYEFYSKDLTAELPFMESVSAELEMRLKSREGCVTPTIANMKYLKEEFDKIIELLRTASAGNKDLK